MHNTIKHNTTQPTQRKTQPSENTQTQTNIRKHHNLATTEQMVCRNTVRMGPWRCIQDRVSRSLDQGSWILDAGPWIQHAGHSTQHPGSRFQYPESRILWQGSWILGEDPESSVLNPDPDPWSRFQYPVSRIKGSGSGTLDTGCGFLDLACWIQDPSSWIHVPISWIQAPEFWNRDWMRDPKSSMLNPAPSIQFPMLWTSIQESGSGILDVGSWIPDSPSRFQDARYQKPSLSHIYQFFALPGPCKKLTDMRTYSVYTVH